MSMANDDDALEAAFPGGIDTSEDDNSGAAPVSGATPDNSGAAPVSSGAPGEGGQTTPAQEPSPTSGLLEGAQNSNMNKGAKRIIAYLMGADAAHPDVLQQAGQTVDPEGQLSAGDRNLLAIEAARAKGGDQAAWALMQSNRVSYNAQTAFAKTALQGTAQKPADLNSAIDAANKAQGNVLDGSNIQFAPSQGGVTATVTMHGTSQPQVINLTPQQFGQFLDVGGDGQWDKVMDQSAPATLQRISQSGGNTPAPSGQSGNGQPKPQRQANWPTPQAQAPQPRSEAQDEPPAPTTSYGKTPSSINLGDDKPLTGNNAGDTNYGDELEQRSRRIFPNVSQEAQRQQWMATQEEQELGRQNKIDVAGETGKQRLAVAKATGASREAVADTTSQAKLKGWQYSSDAKKATALTQLEAKLAQNAAKGAGDAQNRLLGLVKTKIMSGQPLTPQEQAQMDTLPGAAAAGAATQAAAPKPQAQAAPAQQQTSVPPADKRVVNQVYDTPKGKFKWMGNGWQPVQ